MKKRIYSIILAALMIFVQMTVLCTPASAANVCEQIGGDSESGYTFTIDTGSRWIFSDKLTLTQTKGTVKYTNNHLGSNKCDTYGIYTVCVTHYDSKGRMCSEEYTWKATKTLTLKLEKNTYYEVTVTPCSMSKIKDYLIKNNFGVKLNTWGWTSFTTFSWSKAATYKCTSTKGILSCDEM